MGDNINNQAQISSSGIRGYVQLSDGSGGFTSSSQLSFNPTSNILTGNTGITPSIVGQLAVYNGTTSVAGSAGLTYGLTGRLNVTGDLYVSGNTYATNSVTISGPILQIGANNTVKDTTLGLVYARPTGNIAIAYLTTENGGRYQNTLTIGYTLGSSINPLLQIDTQNLLSVNITGNVTANYFRGNAVNLWNTTTAIPGTYGNATTITQILIDSNNRLANIIQIPLVLTLNQVIANGNTTSNTVQFTNSINSLITNGNVGVGNSNPSNLLCIGINTRFNDSGSNTGMVTNGNVTAKYYYGSALYMSNIVTTTLTGTNLYVSYITSPSNLLYIGDNSHFSDSGANTGLITSGNVIAINFNGTNVTTSTCLANIYYGSGLYLSNIAGATTAATYGSDSNMPKIVVDSSGKINSITSTPIVLTLNQVIANGNTTSNTVQFTNSINSLITNGNVGVGNSNPSNLLCIGINTCFNDSGSNTGMVTNGNVTAKYYYGSGKYLENCNITGGETGAIIYQSAPNQTSNTLVGTAGQVLTSNGGSGAPYWAPAISNINGYFGYFYDTIQGQTAATNVNTVVGLRSTNITNGMSLSANTITISNHGTYYIQSKIGIGHVATNTIFYTWWQKNGSNISNSMSQAFLGPATDHQDLINNRIITVNANDTLTMYWKNDDGDGQLLLPASSTIIPGTPVVTVTITQIAYNTVIGNNVFVVNSDTSSASYYPVLLPNSSTGNFAGNVASQFYFVPSSNTLYSSNISATNVICTGNITLPSTVTPLLAPGGAITMNFGGYSGGLYTNTISSNITSFVLSNGIAGGVYTLFLPARASGQVYYISNSLDGATVKTNMTSNTNIPLNSIGQVFITYTGSIYLVRMSSYS